MSTAGERVVQMQSSWQRQMAVKVTDPDALSKYMEDGAEHLSRVELPMGVMLSPLDPAAGLWTMSLPKLSFLDVFVKCVSPGLACIHCIVLDS
jgi:hypothetical protein